MPLETIYVLTAVLAAFAFFGMTVAFVDFTSGERTALPQANRTANAKDRR